jgi:hypothetical protein
MTDEGRTGTEYEGNGCDLIEILSWHLIRGIEENHETTQGNRCPAGIPNACCNVGFVK